jgi:hypothetical protein
VSREVDPEHLLPPPVALRPALALHVLFNEPLAEGRGGDIPLLYVHGGFGYGKTHLLNAAALEFRKRGKRVLFLRAEDFMRHFLGALYRKDTLAFKEELRSAVYESLDVVRVYTKLPTKKEADFDKPFTLKRGGTLLEVAELVHRDLAATFKYARVWSTSLVAPGTQMKGDYVVHDKDVVEIHA